MIRCTLCTSPDVHQYHQNEQYTYHRCSRCDLVFAEPGQRLDPDEEKQRYDQHENDPGDPAYRDFLKQLFDPLNAKLKPGSSGLDYGAGPGPTLSILFREAGHHMEIYDPFYAKRSDALNQEYDFITCTETAEHFYNPGEEFRKLWGLLRPGGILGLMTLLRPEDESFSEWYYVREDTHVAFYSEKTMRWLAQKLDASIELLGERVVLLQKAE
ncbi:MAG: methyltransferase domain-containing protein [Bacteroidetes bacterium]|jgi:SAM-dependent methyltransferase|nr:methyltransferase domain-containing protein [Bacteroidota bacterium]